jgi:hypothetical protein
VRSPPDHNLLAGQPSRGLAARAESGTGRPYHSRGHAAWDDLPHVRARRGPASHCAVRRLHGNGDSLSHMLCLSSSATTAAQHSRESFVFCITVKLNRAKVWTGKHFQRSRLKDLGLVVNIGHRGIRCDHARIASDSFTVIHTNGVHNVALTYCGCRQETHLFLQLLQFGWFPATVKQPNTAVTFQALRQFQNLSLQCKSRSTQHYYLALVSTTDNTSVANVKVSVLHMCSNPCTDAEYPIGPLSST